MQVVPALNSTVSRRCWRSRTSQLASEGALRMLKVTHQIFDTYSAVWVY